MDITMCKGEGCPFRMDCYRYMGPCDPLRQSYFAVAPIYNDDNGEMYCEYYMRLTEEEVPVDKRSKKAT